MVFTSSMSCHHVIFLLGLVVLSSTQQSCPDDGLMNDDTRRKFLKLNNAYRSLVANGLAKDALGGFAPSAAQMPKLRYDCKLEMSAMEHAKRCRFAHSDKKSRLGIGENLCEARFRNINGPNVAQICSKMWFDELERFGVGQENVFSSKLSARSAMSVAHYTQMVWQNTTSMGCAVTLCSGSAIAVCHYEPNGNFIDRIIYEKGTTCSRCPNGLCEDGLCI